MPDALEPLTQVKTTMRHHVVRTVQRAALYSGASLWRARAQSTRRILVLHGIGGADMPLREFSTLMRWLGAHTRVVPLSEMVDAVAAGRPCADALEVALTFDDGLASQYRLAYPVLRELGLSATIFVCPELIDQRRWLWNHEARARWSRLDCAARAEASRQLGAPAADAAGVVAWMKTLAAGARMQASDQLRDLTRDFRPTVEEMAAYDMMTWEQVMAMDARCITIGSHTLSHPILPLLDDAALERELADSRLQLEHRLGREIPLFCYPNGSTDARVRACASRHYRAAVSTEEACLSEVVDLWNLPRIPLSSDLALSAWRLHSPRS